MRARWPGLLVCVGLAAVAMVAAPWIPGVGGILIALGLGALIGNLGWADGRLAPGVKFAEKTVLAIAIGLLGFGLDLLAVAGLGLVALPTLVGLVALTVLLALGLGRWMGLSPGMAWLLGAGQGICGTAAIAATHPVVHASDEELGVAVGVVNALGTVGLVLLPLGLVGLGLGEEASALVLGGSLQSVGHAVAAGFGVSGPVGEATTLVKLGRVALLPVLLLVVGVARRGPGRAVRFPPEILAFVATAVVATAGLLPAPWLSVLDTVTDAVLTVAMAGIGTRIRLSALRGAGARALGVGALLFAVQIVLLLAVAILLVPGA
jgi:uncharacterized integral membrane protein (TIGR00698 family)